MKYLFVVPIFFFVSTALLAQERGIIECHERKSITVWEVPESLLVITQLPCRHEVNIVGLERGYVKIELKENVYGYVEAKYVRSMGFQNDPQSRIAELEAEVNELKQQTLSRSQSEAYIQQDYHGQSESPVGPRSYQNPPAERSSWDTVQSRSIDESQQPTRFDIGGMFSWTRSFDGTGFHYDYLGWNIIFDGNITKHFGLEANVSGNYWNSPVDFVGSSYHAFMGGPRFMFPSDRVTTYIHFLVGLAHDNIEVLGIGFSTNYLALMPGLGLDVNISRNFAVRAFQVDYPLLQGGGEWSYRNIRLGGGIIIKF